MGRLVEFTTGIRSQLVIDAYSGWLKKSDKVLDVGCGDGILSEILQTTFSLTLTACDVENYLKKDISFVQMENASLLPFPKKSFDVVMFNDALHHTTFPNQEKLLKEAFRVSNKVLIFEDEPTLLGSVADWSINKFHNVNMPVTLAFRPHSQWMELFTTLSIEYRFRKIRKPFLYPFLHEAFLLKK